MARQTLPSVDLVAVAQRYVWRWLPERAGQIGSIARLADRTPRLDEQFCRQVADHFVAQPAFQLDDALRRSYERLKTESLRQFEAILDAGIRVEPWLAPGQPYAGSGELCERVRATGTLYVFLTRNGHGPRPDAGPHPLRGLSGVRLGGVELAHNDVFRAVHDVFGHVMFGNSMGPAGEFRATFCHLAMYSDDVHPVLFAEQISQICWFFFGPHLRTADGRLPVRGEPGWIPLAQRPYAEQKVFACPPEFVERFRASFVEVSDDIRDTADRARH
jgi:hypothetical protein